MSRSLLLFLCAALGSWALISQVTRAGLEEYDFANYGATNRTPTLIQLTNVGPHKVINRVALKYDAENITNTVSFWRFIASNSNLYFIASEAGSNVSNDVYEPPVRLVWKSGEIIRITTTETNLNILIDYEP